MQLLQSEMLRFEEDATLAANGAIALRCGIEFDPDRPAGRPITSAAAIRVTARTSACRRARNGARGGEVCLPHLPGTIVAGQIPGALPHCGTRLMVRLFLLDQY